jgi:hypothetical protein
VDTRRSQSATRSCETERDSQKWGSIRTNAGTKQQDPRSLKSGNGNATAMAKENSFDAFGC